MYVGDIYIYVCIYMHLSIYLLCVYSFKDDHFALDNL